MRGGWLSASEAAEFVEDLKIFSYAQKTEAGCAAFERLTRGLHVGGVRYGAKFASREGFSEGMSLGVHWGECGNVLKFLGEGERFLRAWGKLVGGSECR
eukprot:COSAG01_NODE_1038_length_11978_cov_4.983500_10_plen_99_part_00